VTFSLQASLWFSPFSWLILSHPLVIL
jgi:hypothetical protein